MIARRRWEEAYGSPQRRCHYHRLLARLHMICVEGMRNFVSMTGNERSMLIGVNQPISNKRPSAIVPRALQRLPSCTVNRLLAPGQ